MSKFEEGGILTLRMGLRASSSMQYCDRLNAAANGTSLKKMGVSIVE